MSPGPEDPIDVHDRLASGDESDDDSPPEAPVDLMVVSRARRSNAGNRMSTLLAQAAIQQEEEWGEEWEEAPNEEEFVGDEANDQDDYNLDSSSSEDEDEGAEDDTGEKELRKAERQERSKKRKPAANPFAARLVAAARKKVKLDVPSSQTQPAPRPKKKSERASWIPTPEEGPTRMSNRRQTVMNKEETLARLKEKDEKRADTLAMMKAAEERKQKDKPKPMTQAERLAEAARVEKENSKSLHRWEEAEEKRAAERQAKLDALKNRQMQGPFIRYYSGPGIWIDDKLKYTGKEAPKLDVLEEKLNKEYLSALKAHENPAPEQPLAPKQQASEPTQAPSDPMEIDNLPPAIAQMYQPAKVDIAPAAPPHQPDVSQAWQPSVPAASPAPQPPKPEFPQPCQTQTSNPSHTQPPMPFQEGARQPFMGSHDMPYPSSIMFAPPQSPGSFLFGIEQYVAMQNAHNDTTAGAQHKESTAVAPMATPQPHTQSPAAPQAQMDGTQPPPPIQSPSSQLPTQPPCTQFPTQSPVPQPPAHPTTPFQFQPTHHTFQKPPLPQPTPSSTAPFPALPDDASPQTAHSLLLALQRRTPPPPPPPPPKRKTLTLGVRNLVILTSFPTLSNPSSTREKEREKDEAKSPTTTTTNAVTNKKSSRMAHHMADKSHLIPLSTILFNWSIQDATLFLTLHSSTSTSSRSTKHTTTHLPVAAKPLCEISRVRARYRDPGTGLAYRDARAFKVIRGIVGGNVRWVGELGCFVGGVGNGKGGDFGGFGGVGNGKGGDFGGFGGVGIVPARGVPERFLGMGFARMKAVEGGGVEKSVEKGEEGEKEVKVEQAAQS